ncbi:YdiL family protein [Nocardiopsis exhalans]|uniref:YdiL family protein n=1 Tax=Nocardiopsis exhalans TaxID=163604 RepID=A0ABY5D4D6_9ACTN|nr:DUF1870 family protein [Nocardiopsis exhalans]USY18069.1 YdiL family protein [Nocardiopsis exhalans]
MSHTMTGARTVTPAELKSLREHLGFTGNALGAYLTSPAAGRTVRRWEEGKHPIPEGVADEVRELAKLTDTYVQEAEKSLHAQANPTLTVYRDDAEYHHAHPHMARFPAAWHRAVAVRAARQVEGARIVFPD